MTSVQQRIRGALETLGRAAPAGGWCAGLGARHAAPWRVSPHQSGEIVDANGQPVLVVDSNRCVSDQVANRIAFYVAAAVRQAAGREGGE